MRNRALALLWTAQGSEKRRAELNSPAGHLAEYSGMLGKSSGADSKLCEACPQLFLNFLVPSPVVNGMPLTGGGRGEIVAPQLVAIPNMVTMLKLHMLSQPALGRHA